jgi:hypothetical protein
MLSEKELWLDVASEISQLWSDPIRKGIREESGSFIVLSDQAGFFLDAVNRIAADDFVPTDENFLKNRVRTTGRASLDSSIR